MTSLYRIMKTVWVRVPKAIQQFVYDFAPLNYLRKRVRDVAIKKAPHDDIYDSWFYEYSDERMMRSVDAVADSIITFFKPSTVIDVGCGSGALLSYLHSHSINVEGLEYSEAALDLCRSRGLNVTKFDLEKDAIVKPKRFDLVVSTEVAEHLPESCADRYVDLLCNISDKVLITAATPGQGGTDHVNEQPHEYWIEKFRARKFAYDHGLSEKFKSNWKEKGTAWWYYRNVMVFRRTSAELDSCPRLFIS